MESSTVVEAKGQKMKSWRKKEQEKAHERKRRLRESESGNGISSPPENLSTWGSVNIYQNTYLQINN